MVSQRHGARIVYSCILIIIIIIIILLSETTGFSSNSGSMLRNGWKLSLVRTRPWGMVPLSSQLLYTWRIPNSLSGGGGTLLSRCEPLQFNNHHMTRFSHCVHSGSNQDLPPTTDNNDNDALNDDTTKVSITGDHNNDAMGDSNDNTQVEEITRQWLQNIVIGLNLCPFAEKPLREYQLDIQIVQSSDAATILQHVTQELERRIDTPGTTLMVCPQCYPEDFYAFLDVAHAIDDAIRDHVEWEGHVQVAPFHPHFQFEGSDVHAVDNWTNRSPYPIFHVLREVEVERAVDKLDGDAGKVWKRNVNLLVAMEEALGKDSLIRYFRQAGSRDVNIRSKIMTLLRQFRIPK
jgi:uncharacterized protein